jgi:uncharacterized membrane protein YjjB (DUF3815 family)
MRKSLVADALSLASKETLAMGPSIPISVFVGAFVVGCTSTVQVGLANAALAHQWRP